MTGEARERAERAREQAVHSRDRARAGWPPDDDAWPPDEDVESLAQTMFELADTVDALAERVEAAEKLAQDGNDEAIRLHNALAAAEVREKTLREALQQIMEKRPITEDVYDMVRAALSSRTPRGDMSERFDVDFHEKLCSAFVHPEEQA